MARTARVQYEGARYHVINRGSYRKDLFLSSKTAEAFTRVLFETCERHEWWLHAYVLMSNHYHLCVETPHANLSDGMHWLQSTFANQFSRLTGERGHVFQGRYKSLVIEGGFGLLNVVDYIHLNPVRAGITAIAELKGYPNSSFPQYFTKYRHPRLRCEDFLAEADGCNPTPAGMRSYHKRLKLIMEEDPEEREKLFQDLSRGWYIGGNEGKERLRDKIQQGKAKANVDAKARMQGTVAEKLLRSCLKRLNKTAKDIQADKKSAPWKLAVASALKSQTGLKNPKLCAMLNMGHPATMSNLVSAYNQTAKRKCPFAKQLKTQNN